MKTNKKKKKKSPFTGMEPTSKRVGEKSWMYVISDTQKNPYSDESTGWL